MRLADHMMEGVGTEEDLGGIFTKFCASLRQAERFELTDDVTRAAYHLTTSNPTSLLAALPLVRAPYPKLWLEWRGGLTSEELPPNLHRDRTLYPDPIKQGCLIETDKSGQRGTMTFAWMHKKKPEREIASVNIAPLGVLFNWDKDGVVQMDGLRLLNQQYPTADAKQKAPAYLRFALHRRYSQPMTHESAKQFMDGLTYKGWGRISDNEKEREAVIALNSHSTPFIVPCAEGFFQWCANKAVRDERTLQSFMNLIRSSWEPDIEGEGPMIDTVMAMLNSRNAIETRPVDLSGLNRQRAKRGRPLFLPYRTTHLRLSQAQTRAFRNGLLSREEAGEHQVRGHFKVRRTGIFWWSPFLRGKDRNPVLRGKDRNPVRRQSYEVTS